jgi:hypothetical protein
VFLASFSFGFRRAETSVSPPDAPAALPAARAVEGGAAHPSRSSRLLTVKARLADRGLGVPHCGLLRFSSVMRYQVVEVIEGRYREGEILVAQTCPETALRDGRGLLASFRPGDVHWLRLRRAASTSTFADRFAGDELPRYEATQALLLQQ